MQVLDRICGDLFSPKEGVSSAMVIEDPANVSAHILWSCCRTHDVMAFYMKHKFENHPAISAEYIKFLAMNSGSEKVEKLTVQVKELLVEVKTVKEEAKKAAAKATAASSKTADLTQELAALAKKVNI